MNEPFDHYNIKYLSATQINEYIANPARWLLWISGFRDHYGSPAMWRGIAVDRAITKMLLNDQMADIDVIHYAHDEFDAELNKANEEGIWVDHNKAFVERDALASYVMLAVPHYRQLGAPTAAQQRVEIEIDELPIPLIGYTDLQYDDVVRDMKTVGRMTKEIPDSVQRQMAIYRAATGASDVYLDYLYVTKTRQELVVKKAQDFEHHFNVVRQAAANMMRLLSVSPDITDVARLLMPDLSDWRWSDLEREAARKLWRIE